MKFLSDIHEIETHPHFAFLQTTTVWGMPIRFISKEAIDAFYIEAENELGNIEAEKLTLFIENSLTFAEFLGFTAYVPFNRSNSQV